MFWNHLVVDAAHALVAAGRPCFHVAIDCLGYGRSTGSSQQAVRSYPGQLMADIFTSLGRSSAAAMVGSSQGAAAVLNAALERPQITSLRCATR
eukprot:m.88704 g.88704  ORF g.88704 m.88704 type:complete len:94 (-) comp14952_c0_seq3:1863-2144(-)